jgi:hypothetical protein
MNIQIIRDEEPERVQKLLKDVEELNQIQKNLLECVHQQSEQINTIEDNMTLTTSKIESGASNLKIAESYFFNYTPVIVGTTLGAITMGPVGAALHLKLGSLLTIGGGIVGGICGYKIQKI